MEAKDVKGEGLSGVGEMFEPHLSSGLVMQPGSVGQFLVPSYLSCAIWLLPGLRGHHHPSPGGPQALGLTRPMQERPGRNQIP